MATVTTISNWTAAQMNDMISAMFMAAIVKRPILRYMRFGTPLNGSESTFKWYEEARTEVSGTLASNYTAAGTMAVTDGTQFLAHDQIHVENHVDSNFVQIIYRVVSIATNDLTLAVVNGIDTNILTSLGTVIRIHRTQLDNYTPANHTGAVEPTPISSYFELFDETLGLGQKAIDEAAGGSAQAIPDLVARRMEQAANQMAWKLYSAFMWSFGVKEASPAPAKTRGLMEFINTSAAANRVTMGGAALTEVKINDLVGQLVELGLPENEQKVLLMHPDNVRKLATLRQAKVTYPSNESDFGQGAITEYISELPGVGPLEVVMDTNQPAGLVLLISPQWCEIVPRQGHTTLATITEQDPTAQYGKKWVMRSEIGLMCRYATRFHGAIYNITP